MHKNSCTPKRPVSSEFGTASQSRTALQISLGKRHPLIYSGCTLNGDLMDPQQQRAMNQLAGMGAGIMAFALLFSLVVTIFFIWLFWRIFTKAGMSGALALINLVPFVGPIIVLCILAFGNWNVVPVAPGYAVSTQPYPPAYPPAAYPPAGPPTQL